jgi:integrase
MLDGNPDARTFATREAADHFCRRFAREASIAQGVLTDKLIDLWIEARKERGLPVENRHSRFLRTILAKQLDLPAAMITEAHVREGYKRYRDTGVAAATHHDAIDMVKRFFRWAVKAKHLRKDPSAEVEKLGKANKRKPQVETVAELFRLRDTLWTMWREEQSLRALAALVSLYTGARQGEVLGLLGRHVDQGDAGRLVLPGTKNENAKRAVRVFTPELWTALVERANAVGPQGRLFPISQTHSRRVIKITVERASLSEALTFHSLRGIAASLATRGDAATAAIASALGHHSYEMTSEHYATKSAQADALSLRNFRVLDGGPSVPAATSGSASSPSVNGAAEAAQKGAFGTDTGANRSREPEAA